MSLSLMLLHFLLLPLIPQPLQLIYCRFLPSLLLPLVS
jgi:hypothetical protein